MMLQNGLNRIRSLHANDIDKAWMGTDGSAVTESQTGLQAGVSASKKAVTVVPLDKMNVFSYLLDKDNATGNTFREFAIIKDGTVEYTRTTMTGIEHTANDDLVCRQTIYYRNP